ncbi:MULTISPECIES: PTS lactose/cellobiose transporter subunit IIA [Oceanobacillus]|uniref:Lichenan-specific phosphotransferase enzyme IIA component n=1 Tax=Oceanobacillus kimchii TaxID=746691 RepID=A0ABQ5TMF7_9BACI|nr:MULTISPECIES: PTS lactose/cellobiose transporter subunit IIA [Oceanobacillus]MBT2600725.1 PTS lactose/cellobiose transporter subunit IIA [Oceanobacillus sp. ISL-74]MBT2650878.1 PTS lactose/cellobiose transporter subunit IIA [Oceanobacillus sp. ISL-73]MCT1575480.1 PTS lactose/cellobiose transporter subunit IIA [Oceanobacillus kimchii]MCT2138053.1 PTS lactose/cellobiose transporter subunit IIA [Oceanobacillus kimchii]GLO66941.1 lichenan-specific phosphotransferase enzyme IIA component [Oceano
MTIQQEELQVLSFQIILHAGNARSEAMEALQLARNGEFNEAELKLETADKEFTEAHHIQTSLLQDEANGTIPEFSIILIHAQDHLMNALTVKDLAIEMIAMQKQIKKLEER